MLNEHKWFVGAPAASLRPFVLVISLCASSNDVDYRSFCVLDHCGVCSLTDPLLRYRGHQASQHGGSDGGDNSSRVPPSPLPLVCVQQQQGHPAPLWHESLCTLWQTHQMWAMLWRLETSSNDLHAVYWLIITGIHLCLLSSVWGTWRSREPVLLLRDHFLCVGRQVQSQWTLFADQRLPHRQGVGPEHGQGPRGDIPGRITHTAFPYLCFCLIFYCHILYWMEAIASSCTVAFMCLTCL